MPLFSPLERQIVQALTSHISQNEEVSLTVLAQECHASKSSVVKAVQKLGYRGFNDLSYNVRFNAQTSSGSLLPRAITEDSFDAASDALTRCLGRCPGRRNFIFSGDRRCGALIASYMSRKLAMFEIFAPPSYDYAMTARGDLPLGVAFFCFHRELPRHAQWGQQEGYGRGMLKAAREAGFFVVAFSDDPSHGKTQDDTDLMLRISPNDGIDVDLYATRVIMLFEAALARFSATRGEGR